MLIQLRCPDGQTAPLEWTRLHPYHDVLVTLAAQGEDAVFGWLEPRPWPIDEVELDTDSGVLTLHLFDPLKCAAAGDAWVAARATRATEDATQPGLPG